MVFTRRWRGRSVKDVSESMSALAQRKQKRMTKEERKEHSKVMIAARGAHWRVDAESGKRVYFN